jgi:hypothetical protein
MVQSWRESPARREPSLSDSGVNVVTFHHVTMHLLAPVPANLLFVVVSELSAPGGVFRPSAAKVSGEVFLSRKTEPLKCDKEHILPVVRTIFCPSFTLSPFDSRANAKTRRCVGANRSDRELNPPSMPMLEHYPLGIHRSHHRSDEEGRAFARQQNSFARDIGRFSLLLGHSRVVFDDKYWTGSVLDNTVGGASEQQTSEPGITM